MTIGRPTLLARLLRWSEERRQLTNVRLVSIALVCVVITYSGTTIATGAASSPAPEAEPATERAPAFGVAGVGRAGICAEIDDRDTDPPRQTDCESRRLADADIDLDQPRGRARTVDIVVGDSVLRARGKAYFLLLDIDERPSYAKCAAHHPGRRYRLSFTDLPGLTVCARSDEGRTAILQAESIDARGKVIEARLTVWDKP